MPDASIVVKMTDRYSETARKMAQVTRHFSKDAEQLEDQLHQLDKNKYTLKMDLSRAKSQLKEAERQFDLTRSAADGLKVELAHANYDGITRNLKTVTRAARDTEREISKLYTRGAGAAPSSSGGSMGQKLAGAIGAVGVGQLAGNLLTSGGSALAGSLLGSRGGNVLGGALGAGAQGAAAGFALGLGPVGALVGGLAGAAGGALTGGLQNLETRDQYFKGFVQGEVEGQLTAQKNRLTSGTALAAGRETDLISFSTLLGGKDTAQGYLKSLVTMANTTPFLYQDLTQMSKVLATYKFSTDRLIPTLTAIGDAGAALGLNTQDMSMVGTALGRMKSSGKTQLETINMLQERGIDAVGMLAAHYGTNNGGIYDRISKGSIAGGEAVEIILEGMARAFGGSMARQSGTYAGLSSTLEGMQQEQANAMGEGYTAERKKGIQKQIDYLGGPGGALMAEANGAMGAWQASEENKKEQYIRTAQLKAMGSLEYINAQEQGDAVTMGRILQEAEIEGRVKYNGTEGAQLMVESQKTLIESVREDTSVNAAYWDAGYQLGGEFEKGIAAGLLGQENPVASPDWMTGYGDTYREAVGLPSLKADGTAPVIAAGSSSTSVTVSGNTFTVREEADIPKIAAAIAQRLAAAEGG